jgi:hypothetical protein
MANAVKAKATGKSVASKATEKVATKVSKKLVAKLNEFVETRSLSNLYKKLVEEGRAEIFAEIGEVEQVLIHNGVEVAIISKVVKPDIDRDILKEKFPEAWEACQTTRNEFHIRKATPKR